MDFEEQPIFSQSDDNVCPSHNKMIDEVICSKQEDLGKSPNKLGMLESTNTFTFLEDIDPPSFLGSSIDSCMLHSSTPNSTLDTIQQEQLVSISSTDENFRSYLVGNSMIENHSNEFEPSAQILKDAKQMIAINSIAADVSKDMDIDNISSISNNQENIDHTNHSCNKTKSTDCSFNFEAEAEEMIGLLEQADVSTTTEEEHQSFLDLDKISDSILIDSTSREESVFLHNDVEASPQKGDKVGESFIVVDKAAKKTNVNTTFETDQPRVSNAVNGTPLNSLNIGNKFFIENKKSPMNATFEKLPSRMQKVNRTFDKCSESKAVECDRTEVENETVGVVCDNKATDLGCGNNTIDLGCNISKDVQQPNSLDKAVEDLNNGMFLMGGKETSLMDMEASDLLSVLSHANTSRNVPKRHSLQSKEKSVQSKSIRRISLTTKDNIKSDENKLHKKLDINPFSSINLFKGKLRGNFMRKNDERKGPMKATYVPEQKRLEDSPGTIKTRAASSPCTGSKMKKGSKSDSETSGAPMPSFGSVSTIDSDRPSTPDLGTSNTPEVFRRKNSASMLTSTPAMNCEGPYGKMHMPRMTDVPTPIAAPSNKTPLRNITETLTACGENGSFSKHNRNEDKNEEEKMQETLKSLDNEVTIVKNVKDRITLNITTQKDTVQAANADPQNKPVNGDNLTNKENLKPTKTRPTNPGQPLKEKGFNTRRISTVKSARSVIKPLSKPAIVTNRTNTGRLAPKAIPRQEKKTTTPKTELPVNKHQPRRSVAGHAIPKNQSNQRRSVSSKPLVTSSKPVNQVSLPKKNNGNIKAVIEEKAKNTPNIKTVIEEKTKNNPNIKAVIEDKTKNTASSDDNKRCSAIPRPTFKSKFG